MPEKHDFTLYILVRIDMPSMKYGKGSAQACHASNTFTNSEVIRPLLAGETPGQDVTRWRKSTTQGFGTTVCLSVEYSQMVAIVDVADKLGYPAGIVVDPEYPYLIDKELYPLIAVDKHTDKALPRGDKMVCFRREETCAYVFGSKAKIEILLKQFKLLDND